jgi:hypothetical protein
MAPRRGLGASFASFLRIVAEEMFVAAGFEVESVQRADHALDIVAQRSDHLDEALSQFDRSCDDFEMGRL